MMFLSVKLFSILILTPFYVFGIGVFSASFVKRGVFHRSLEAMFCHIRDVGHSLSDLLDLAMNFFVECEI